MVHALWADRIGSDRLDVFETWLDSEPVLLDPDDLELRSALGLRGQGG